MFDMFNIMNKVKEAQEKMKATQENLVNINTTTEVGGGMVKVTINGHRQIVKMEIDPEIMNDKEMVQDLIIAAFNKASSEIDALIKQEMSKSMEGILPNIPGLDINSLMGGMR